MTGKKVAFGGKPQTKPEIPATPDSWVKDRDTQEPAPMKRLTLDVPESLHRKIKAGCASRGTKMADEIRILLEANYG